MTGADSRPTRREYLALCTATLTGLAGCGTQSSSDPTTSTTTAMPDSTMTTQSNNGPGGGDTDLDIGDQTTTDHTTVPEHLGDHPAGRSINTQPVLGTLDAPATIVAFEDPSCPRCRAFERQVVPTIREELLKPGNASFVFRGYPVVYPWGVPAAHALEATHAQDPAVHFRLAAHYFETQSEFTTSNVVDRTEAFLTDEPTVDAGAVATAAADRTEADAVNTDLSAGMDAGASQITPHLFLFKDGEFLTKASGSVSYDLIAAALDV